VAQWMVDLGWNVDQYINYLEPYQDKILLGTVFVCIFLILREALGLILDRMPRRARMEKGPKDKSEYYPVIVGAMLGFSVMSQKPLLAVSSAVLGGVLGYVARKAYLWFVSKLTEEKRAGEILLLYEIVSVYSSAGYSLYEALSAGAYLADAIGGPLRKCLRSWGQGPERALKKMGEELKLPEGDALVRILQRAVVIGPGRLAEFLSQEGRVMEAVRQYRIERGLGVRPVVQTLYLLLPGLALLGVTLMPVGYHIAKAITSIKLS